jgi:hypothetical protein
MSNEKELVPYSEFTEQMESLRERADFLPDMSTKEGYEASKRIHLDYRKLENGVDKERKARKKYWADGGKAVDKEGNGIAGEVADLRQPHTEAYQKVDAEKKEREAKRVAELEGRVAYIRDLPASLGFSSSDEIKLAMEEMQAEECFAFYEYANKALEARNATRETLGQMYTNALQQEKDAAELKELRAKQAEQVIVDKVEAGIAEAMAVNIAPVQRVAPTPDYDHKKNFNGQALNDLAHFAGLSSEQAKSVVEAIARNQISNITINY